MPKQSAKLNNLSGGIDLATAERDIESNECVDVSNFSLYRPGLIFLGHKAIEYNYQENIYDDPIPALLALGYDALPGAGFAADAYKTLKNQIFFQFRHNAVGANWFTSNFNAPMFGVNTTWFNMDSGGDGGNKIYVTTTSNKPYDNLSQYGQPLVNWINANEIPKPGRANYEFAILPNAKTDGYINEWCRWEYEAGYENDLANYPSTDVYSPDTSSGEIHMLDTSLLETAWASHNYPPPGDEYVDCAQIQKPRTNHNRTVGGTTINTVAMMSLRWDRMMSGHRGSTAYPKGSVMSTNTQTGGNDHLSELLG